ncbi:MAG: hypothetical protein QM741_12545 [Rudaea sp.]
MQSQIRALLRGYNIRPPTVASETESVLFKVLWTARGCTWLRSVSWPNTSAALRCEVLADELDLCDRTIKRLTAELDQRADAHPGVQLVCSIPGVGPRTASGPHWFSRAGRARPKAILQGPRGSCRPTRPTARKCASDSNLRPGPTSDEQAIRRALHVQHVFGVCVDAAIQKMRGRIQMADVIALDLEARDGLSVSVLELMLRAMPHSLERP